MTDKQEIKLLAIGLVGNHFQILSAFLKKNFPQEFALVECALALNIAKNISILEADVIITKYKTSYGVADVPDRCMEADELVEKIAEANGENLPPIYGITNNEREKTELLSHGYSKVVDDVTKLKPELEKLIRQLL